MTDIVTRPYRLTFHDHASFTLVTYYRRVFASVYVVFYAAMILLLPALLLLTDKTPHRYVNMAQFIALNCVVWLVLIPSLSLYSLWRQFQSNKALKSESVVTLSDLGVDITGRATQTRLTWQNFSRLSQNRDKLFLYLAKASAIIIPKAAFASPEDRAQFTARATALIKAARHPQANVFEAPPQTIDLPSDWRTQPFAYTFPLHFSFYLRLFYRSLFRPVTLLTIVIFGSIVPLWINRQRIELGDWRGIGFDAVVFVPFIAVTLLLMPVILALWSWMTLRTSPRIKGLRSAALTPDRIVCVGPSYHVEILLADLRAVQKSGGVLLFYTRPNCAIAIPLSAFTDKTSAMAFYEQAVTWWRVAKSAPASNSSLDAKG